MLGRAVDGGQREVQPLVARANSQPTRSDYRSPTVIGDLIAALRGRRIAGAVSFGAGSARGCIDVLGACEGNRVLAMASPPVSFDDEPRGGRGLWMIRKIATMLLGNIRLALRARRRGVRYKFVFGSTLFQNEVGPMIYGDFLPRALADARYRPVPPAEVVGSGLDAIPDAMARQKRGVSATKLVVTL